MQTTKLQRIVALTSTWPNWSPVSYASIAAALPLFAYIAMYLTN
ncbi:hypothetical protein [Polycladidibacter stylochi]|nr:hypothetical protein [Pseudovibrio stylochi]